MERTILIADHEITNLSKVSLETKELLPEYSGIYYVVDEKKIVWYIGKARNIRKRWQGNAHHRIYQLKQQKYKAFCIYYENINSTKLDKEEKKQIKKYNPHLNNSPVKNKKVRPTETLLRETVATISDFAFILGIEPPRREIKDSIGINWLIQEQFLDLPIIHICLNLTLFKTKLTPQSINQWEALIKKPFSTRKAYASKWDGFPRVYPFTFCLSVNGFIIEVNYFSTWVGNDNADLYRAYNNTKIAQIPIKALTLESLNLIKSYNLKQQLNKIRLERLQPYYSDLIPLFFDQLIDIELSKEKLQQLSHDFKTGKKGLGSRSRKDFTSVDKLLLLRGIDIHKYDTSNVGSFKRGVQERIKLYIKCFNLNPEIPYHYSKTIGGLKVANYNSVLGIINGKQVTSASCKFYMVYLSVSVDKKAWLLIENYLKDFANTHIKLNDKEGIIDKFYVSPRKFIAPAKVYIKLESMEYSIWIPFGMSEQYPTFNEAKQEIKKRLKEANLPKYKLIFKKENVTK